MGQDGSFVLPRSFSTAEARTTSVFSSCFGRCTGPSASAKGDPQAEGSTSELRELRLSRLSGASHESVRYKSTRKLAVQRTVLVQTLPRKWAKLPASVFASAAWVCYATAPSQGPASCHAVRYWHTVPRTVIAESRDRA